MNNTPTAARPVARKDSHWYTTTGEARYEIIGKTTGKPRAVNLRDAREGNLLPGVTSILNILHKEGLVAWRIEQAVLACLTTPRKEGEEIDVFVDRVLNVERVQDQESAIARDKGTEIHGALELYFSGQRESIPEDLLPWILPAARAVEAYGEVVASEKILVGDGYAGKTDLILKNSEFWWLWDYKTTKKLPDPVKGGAWSEHKLQLSAYAKAFMDSLDGAPTPAVIKTGNVYISTLEEGKFVICEHAANWHKIYSQGFQPLVTHWQWANSYYPNQPKPEAPPPPPPPAVTEPATVIMPRPKDKTIGGQKVAWSSGISMK